MRRIINSQMKIGEIPISKIQFDLQSRDEIPKLLMGLQSIYCNKKVREKVFNEIEKLIPDNVSRKTGRKGMNLWSIFVLGTLRLVCNWDFDKLTVMANGYRDLRLMLGISHWDVKSQFALQTIKDNISLFTDEILDRINVIVVNYGHEIIGKKNDEEIKGSCDSFPVETNVHFPTDINLLFDAMRKTITLIMYLCDNLGLTRWRKGISILRKVKRSFRRAQMLKHSSSKDPKKKAERNQLIIAAHLFYLELAKSVVENVQETIDSISSPSIIIQLRIEEIKKFISHAERQIDQIYRRVVEDETIPHHEKVFSLFEEHTEWIKKGKAGVSQELGLNVCIVKDQFGFILHHHVMQKETDDKIAVQIIRETKERFPSFNSCSFDKGFHSPYNQEELRKLLDNVVLPRKGKLSAINKEVENSEEFKRIRRKHSSVESSINALENHGLDRCPDRGIHGFKRYVGLAVVARNIQIIGHTLQQMELKHQQRLKNRLENKRAA